MRLKSIKLAGFKSFVDPTTVNFPSNLAGVVGPNGCGKSNVIDAVRWVMGESSAKQLRGDSMTDVIFNGSSGRKPVGQASIELIFDNDSGRITGEYASYNEISIRRRVTREGQSDYYLNGSKCRRRDITDIFLGTGLGARSYSIIEQGMISSLITARPEDLRVYIEEAAGISKYKERRRDTENRIRRTRENLERLTDLRDELGRQLSRLQRQAQAAERYREYKTEERELQEQLLALRWKALDEDINRRKEVISHTELEVEKYVVAELGCNTEIEKFREAINERTDAFNSVQSKYYEIGAEIARLEQTIKHQQERRQQLEQDIHQTEQSYQEVQNHINNDSAKVEGWKAELEELARQRVEAEMLAEETAAELEQLEGFSVQAQEAWDVFQTSSGESRQRAEVEQSRIKHFEQSMQSIAARRERIYTKLGEDEGAQIAAQQANELESQREELEEKLELVADIELEETDVITQLRTALDESANSLDETRSMLQKNRGRLSSLEALQEAALSEGQSGVESWLMSNDLSQSPRLADSMKVDKGWELAVETVLGGVLKAICLDEIETVSKRFDDFQEGTLDILETSVDKAVSDDSVEQDSLLSKIKEGPADLRLSSVYVARDLADALSRRKTLKAHESVITEEGLWFGVNWCRVSRGEALGSGVIERKAEIESLLNDISTLEEREEQQREKITESQSRLNSSEEQLRQKRREKETLSSELSSVVSKISALKAKYEQILQQIEHSKAELEAANEQYEIEEAQLAEARIAVAEAIDAMEQDTGRRDELLNKREESRLRLSESRNQNQQQAQMSQQFAMREQMVQTQLSSLEETTLRMQSQLERLSERRETLRMSSAEDEGSLNSSVAEELEERLEARLGIESKLTQAREELTAVEQQIKKQEEQRLGYQQSLLQVRERLQEQRLQSQDLLTRRSTLEEQLADNEPESLVNDLPDGANESEWVQRLTTVQTRIQRLGPINLAAIDEYKIESERKVFLDEQDAELVEALDTLESAIRKIDKETRTRFKETFDKIDTGFKELFPRLFGGGHAYLELTGEDLLETGVTIMARPPGKRNSTIHLLSGGEKAMTAIALVFSIFHLNPAPFCMLDEVDAPLDDANVERFANMVKEMSEKVQFIFISHNKVTMEIADQLMGVTMHEPGVSRLVTVDVESAIKMSTS